MKRGINANPGDHEAGERGEKSLFDHLPWAAIFLLVHALKVVGINVKRAGVDEAEGRQACGAPHGYQTPNNTENCEMQRRRR